MVQSASQLRGSPSNYIFPSRDPAPYVPVITGFGTPTGVNFIYWTLGSRCYVYGKFSTTTWSAVIASIGLPNGYIYDFIKMGSQNNCNGRWNRVLNATANNRKSGPMYFPVGESNVAYFTSDDYSTASQPGLSLNASAIGSGTETIEVYFDFHVKGLSGNVPLLNVKTTSPILAGMVMAWPGATIPDGWGDADGAAINIADYPDYYTNIGTAYNTQINPTTGAAWAAPSAGTFRKPDYRGIMLKGAGTALSVTTVTVGGYQADQNLSHNHNISTGGSGSKAAMAISNAALTFGGSAIDATISVGGDEVRTRNKGVRWIVKLFNESFYPLSAPNAGASNGGFVSSETGGTISASYSGAATGVVPLTWYKIGKMVFAELDPISFTATTGAQLIVSLTGLPASARPRALAPAVRVVTQVVVGGVAQTAVSYPMPTYINYSASQTGSNWPSSGSQQQQATCFTWLTD